MVLKGTMAVCASNEHESHELYEYEELPNAGWLYLYCRSVCDRDI